MGCCASIPPAAREWIVESFGEGSGDGMAIDVEGRLYVCCTSEHAVRVYEPDGTEVDRLEVPKSGKARVVVVPPHIRADLKAHLDANVEKAPEALLFPPARGGCHINDKVFHEQLLARTESCWA